MPIPFVLPACHLPPPPPWPTHRQHVYFQEAQVQPAEFFWTRGAVGLPGPSGWGAISEVLREVIALEMISPDADGRSGCEESCQGEQGLQQGLGRTGDRATWMTQSLLHPGPRQKACTPVEQACSGESPGPASGFRACSPPLPFPELTQQMPPPWSRMKAATPASTPGERPNQEQSWLRKRKPLLRFPRRPSQVWPPSSRLVLPRDTP